MWTRSLCLICIYILRNYAFQISNEASFLAFLQPAANRLKFFIPPSRRLGKTSSVDTFTTKPHAKNQLIWTKNGCFKFLWHLVHFSI